MCLSSPRWLCVSCTQTRSHTAVLSAIHQSGNTIGTSQAMLHNSCFPVCVSAGAKAANQSVCLSVCVRLCVSGCGYPSYSKPSLIFHSFAPSSLGFPCAQSRHLDTAGCLSAPHSHSLYITHTHSKSSLTAILTHVPGSADYK